MEDFNVVFFGGSITNGAGASNYKNSYVHIVGEYLKNLYKNKRVNIMNSGISGTGSAFGLFRLKKDVVVKKPNLVFIEFAVNDRIESSNYAAVTMEGILSQLSRLEPRPAVALLIAPTGLADACGSVHKHISYYYGVPVIDIQDYVFKHIGMDEYTWKDISIDNLHPNDRGHNIYAECIVDAIKKNLDVISVKPLCRINTITGYSFKNPDIVSYEKAEFYGHWREEQTNMPQMKIAAVSDSVGDFIEFKFNGRCIAITTLFSDENGGADINIDGINYFLDLYRNSKPSFLMAINIFNLSDGCHDMTIKVSSRKNRNSRGNKVVVGGFLIDD
ncbi:MAG: SGNH/GDSL hydrolase family protein [Clostridium sp.]|jgi:lysophospholipase L1-like esterase|uniref:SGNH/GDSL hydrolase family protein n=1 Tax=Clostridium sp. TaxID=1506 RepID=UPI0025C29BAC|nr:SGNH/GDSL hydrolase family protein [Clostridium sp.]MCH3964303.1 SGNH/GDSL hydrolase family protein [Clostridium sp.]MCI1715478.1 SGNH/GDSL hydrolase family protein [Clostridium sp.]MCI1799730.1 SGNH/GDSL hydrolase family protein [Clostridium sp.]MCI1813662.1 SGNH/GDSL hydrolase family protein [Clostridium sp.]MCI1870543.1 SGNH/GDSL hydrolase family protein [Clostridium sp.]